jgi:hypothetical protein
VGDGKFVYIGKCECQQEILKKNGFLKFEKLGILVYIGKCICQGKRIGIKMNLNKNK